MGWDFYSSLAVSDQAKESGMQIVSGYILTQTKVEVGMQRESMKQTLADAVTQNLSQDNSIDQKLIDKTSALYM